MKKISDILLVELPPWDPRTPPLGIAYLATFLKSKGVNVKVFDLNIEMYNSESDERKKGWGNEDYHWWGSDGLEERYLSMFEYFADTILSFNAETIGFSATMPSIAFLNRLLRHLKKKAPDKTIIVGGPATFFLDTRRQEFDTSLIDYFVVGDGEIALYELLKALGRPSLARRFSLSRHASSRRWKDSIFEKVICIQTPKIQDLDSVPPPTFEEFCLSAYTEGHFTLPILFSKGCTRSCTFCSDVVLSRPYRCRKPETVIKEIGAHLKRYMDINTFRLNDLSLNANLKFLNEFCDRIIAEDLRIKWYGQAQVRPDMNDSLLAKMKKAGCWQFSLGLETFSNNVLSLMKKGYTGEDAVRFLKRSKEAGIENNIAIIVGYPGETEEDFNIILESIRRNAAYIDRICSLNICGMPIGSELRRYPEKYNYFFPSHGDWTSFDHTNTFAVRKKRYNEVIHCCNELNITVDACLDLDIFEEGFKR